MGVSSNSERRVRLYASATRDDELAWGHCAVIMKEAGVRAPISSPPRWRCYFPALRVTTNFSLVGPCTARSGDLKYRGAWFDDRRDPSIFVLEPVFTLCCCSDISCYCNERGRRHRRRRVDATLETDFESRNSGYHALTAENKGHTTIMQFRFKRKLVCQTLMYQSVSRLHRLAVSLFTPTTYFLLTL